MFTSRCVFLTAVLLFIFPGASFAQTVANPGCKIAWDEPTQDDPANPGTQVGSWALAGDHKGFVFVTRLDDQHTWDKLLEQHVNDPTLREIECTVVGVENLGQYSLGITAIDTSLNQSGPAWISFSLVAQDNIALPGVAEICMNGLHLGQPIQTCQKAVVPVP